MELLTLICPRAITRSVWELRAITQSVRELWHAKGFNVHHFKFLLWGDRTPLTFLLAQMVKCLPTMQETLVQSLDWEDLLEKKWQPTSAFLPGKSHGQSMGSQSDTTEHFLFWQFLITNNNLPDFPGGPVFKNRPFNEGDVDLIPGQGTNFPHTIGHLSPWSATREADVPPRRPSTAKTKRETQYFKNIEGTPIKILLDYW